PRAAGPGNYLSFAAGGPTIPAEPVARVGPVSVTDWSRNHPVLRYVNLQQLDIRQSWRAQVRPWGQELAAGSEGPLIVAGERQDYAIARDSGHPGAEGARTFRSLYVGFSGLQ